MIQYSPRSLTIHESRPASSSSFDIELRDAAGAVVLASKPNSVDADPSGDTTIPLADLYTEAMLGAEVTFWARENSALGIQSAWQQAAGSYTIVELPDGAEAITVNL